MDWYNRQQLPACRQWVEQAIDEGATLYVERGRLRHHGDLPLTLLTNLYDYEPHIVQIIMRSQWSHPLTAAGQLRRMLADGLTGIDIQIVTSKSQIEPGRVAEYVERLLRHAHDPREAEEIQAVHAVLNSWLGHVPREWRRL